MRRGLRGKGGKAHVTPGDFSFRVSCYEQFGWSREQVRSLPETEAALLAVYFEELANHRADQSRQGSSTSAPPGYTTEFEVDEEDGYDDE